MVIVNELSPRVAEVTPLGGRRVRVVFTDGTVATVDLTPLLQGPMFENIAADDHVFAQVRLSPGWGCLEWPNGADIDPEVLYEFALAGRASSTGT